MDVQDQSKHSIPSGHESHGVYLCRRCGWPFPNPHPSAKHRRSHKKICGTIDGYTNLIHSEVVSDDENHLDDDKDKTPSPKIQKKTSIGGGGGAIGGSFSRSEDESFLDAVTEFADTTSTGSANKTLDRDLFFSFKDAEHGDFKVDSSEAKSDLLETNGKSSDDLVKVGVVEPTLKQSDVSQEAQLIDDVGAGVKLETVTSDGVNEEIKHEKLESECEPVSEVVKEAEIVHGAEKINEEIKLEKFEMEHEHATEAVKEPETVQSVSVLTQKEDLDASECSKEQILQVEKEPDMVLTQIKEQIQEVVKEPESVSSEKDDLCAPESEKELSHEVVEEPESVLIEKEDLGAPKLEKDLKEQIQEDFNESIAILTENKDLVAPKLETCSTEEIEEVVKEPKSVLIEKEDLGAPESETHSNKHTHEVSEEPESVLSEKDDLGAPILEKSSKEDTLEVVQEPNSTLIKKEDLETPKLENGSTKQIQESVKEPESILTEKQDLDAPESEKCSNEHTHEVVEEPKTVLTEKDDLGASILEKSSKEHTFEAIEEPNSSSIEKEDLGAPNLEKHSNDHTHEVLEEPDTVLTKKENLEAQNLEKLPKEATKEPKVDDCIVNDKNTSGVVSEPIIGKLITNQDSGVDLSIDSSNSLEANWGSVSAQIYIKKDFNCTDVQIEVLVGILNVYSLVGSAAAGKTSDMIGRRYTIVLAGAIFFIGAILMGFATNYAFLMVGRFVAGIGVGYALMIAPVYTAEVSPASARGFLTSFPEVFINAGILLGYVSNFAFSKLPLHLGWRFMLGIGAIPSIFLAFGVLGMPESPRWLVMQGRLGDAKIVLDKTSDSLEESKLRLADIKEAAGIPEDCDDDIVQVPKRTADEAIWKELLLHPTPTVRHILMCGVGIHFFQQASGIDAVVLYSTKIFEKAGIKRDTPKLLATIAVGFVKTIFILVATFFLDKVGRRPLLLSSVAGMIVSLMGLAFGLTIIEHSDQKIMWAVALCIATVLTYVAFFSIGMGPITWVYSSEIFPLRLRAQGCSIGVAMNRVVSGVISMTFLSLTDAITIGGAFFLFTGIAIVAFVFFYTLFPETHGRNLEEVEQLFGTFFRWRSRSVELKMKREAEMATKKAQE